MAQKRCFTPKIVESDAFLEMPLSTQCLYFHLNFSADDDGFVNSPKKVMKMVGCSEDDLKLLIAKSFVLVFESGVLVIKHYRMHNTLKNDRYKPTDYQEEFAQLGLKDNNSYTWKQNVSILETQHNITKHNITQHNLTMMIERLRESGIDENKIVQAIGYINDQEIITEQLLIKAVDVINDERIYDKEAYIQTIIRKGNYDKN